MATGFVPYLLKQSKQVFMDANPSSKVTPPGFLNFLLRNSKPSILSEGLNDGSGHQRGIQVKYRTRGIEQWVSSYDNCAIDVAPSYRETSVSTTYFSKLTIHISDQDISKYENDASKTVAVGKPSTPLMNEIYMLILEQAQGLFQRINRNLVTSLSTSMGVNVVTGAATAQTVNFNLSGAVNNFAEGMTKVMSDVVVNEMNPNNVAIVGNGFINSFFMQKQFAAMSANQSGINNANIGNPDFFWDPMTTAVLGANRFVVIEKNAFQLINITQFKGSFAGDKGRSIFGTITLPVADAMGNSLLAYEFDFQLKYNDCPQVTTVAEYGGASNYVEKRGWEFTLMSTYDLFKIPSDAYNAGDRLTGNNGSLYFAATNS